jgi:hypothetical protein
MSCDYNIEPDRNQPAQCSTRVPGHNFGIRALIISEQEFECVCEATV